MGRTTPIPDVNSILSRMDRSSPEAALSSLASEFVSLYRMLAQLQARVTTMELPSASTERVMQSADQGVQEELLQEFVIDAQASLLRENGFYEVQHDSSGVPYRWTGPEREFSFEFFISRETPGTFSLVFSKIYSGVPASGLRCRLDGKNVPLELEAIKGGVEVRGILPARPGSGASVLTFVCPKMASPFESQKSKDRRLLGVSFRRLVLRSSGPGSALTEPATVGQAGGVAAPMKPAQIPEIPDEYV